MTVFDASSASEIFSRLAGVATLVSSCVVGIGALVKFRAWWIDRMLGIRIESAQALKMSAGTDELRAFAQRQFVRLHFLRLTTLDRINDVDSDLNALLACHRSLGGRDEDWRRMGRAGRFLLVRDDVVHVAPIDWRAWLMLAAAVVLGAAMSLATAVLIILALALGPLADIPKLTPSQAYWSLMMTLAATVPGAIAWIAWRHSALILDAATLRAALRRRSVVE